MSETTDRLKLALEARRRAGTMSEAALDRAAWIATNPLRVWRSQHRVSQDRAAELLNCRVLSVRRWESSYRVPRPWMYSRIARLIGVRQLDLEKEWNAWLKRKPENDAPNA